MKRKKLRSGFTTGACAAAAAKATAIELMSLELGVKSSGKINQVEIPFPDGSRHKFKIHTSKLITLDSQLFARASVIKDAGDDPDVTNGAEIVAEVRVRSQESGVKEEEDLRFHIQDSKPLTKLITLNSKLFLRGGKGVGMVTKPGLPVPVGEPAINPVPRQMINEAVMEAIEDSYKSKPTTYPLYPTPCTLEITISVPNGEELAKKTLNSRLGIIGGISILGTTGIVKPVSTEAWTATIISSMDVARAAGRDEIVLSAGRTSEKAHMKKFNLPEESYVLMGDYLEFSLREAKKHGFKKIHLCAQWAKMVKIAMATPQTHVRFGAIDMKKTMEFLQNLSSEFVVGAYCNTPLQSTDFNTAREIFDFINLSLSPCPLSLFSKVCNAARDYAEKITGGFPVSIHLVSYEGEVIAESE